MTGALELYFEEDVEFRLEDKTPIAGSVYIGATEFDPVKILRQDPTAYRSEFEAWLDEIWLPEQRDRRLEILSLHGNAKRYKDLCSSMKRGQVVPFIGSGMSVPSGLPTWSDLLRKIRDFTDVQKKELDRLLRSYKFEEAALLLADGANARLFNERVEHELRIEDPAEVRGAVRLLPALFPGVAITTNLDGILELHYERCERAFAAILEGKSLGEFRTIRSDGKSYLLKLHGDCKRPSNRVLLPNEYDAAYARRSIIREELSLLYRNNSLLFLGCSLGADRTVKLVANVAGGDPNMPKHYAFLKCPPDAGARIKREKWLTHRGIYPIWYTDDHDTSISCLLAGLIELQTPRSTNGAAR